MLSSDTPIDVVFILSTHEYHAEQSIQCLKSGKHVFVEKPMAQTVNEIEQVEQARKESGKVVFVGYMRRYALALERLKEAIKGKDIKCKCNCPLAVGIRGGHG